MTAAPNDQGHAPIQFVKIEAGLYDMYRDGERIGRTATHPRVFPRHWWAEIKPASDNWGERALASGTGKTRAEAVAAVLEAEARSKADR